MRGLIGDTILVRVESIIQGMILLHSHAGIVAEPSGARGIAALIENGDWLRGNPLLLSYAAEI